MKPQFTLMKTANWKLQKGKSAKRAPVNDMTDLAPSSKRIQASPPGEDDPMEDVSADEETSTAAAGTDEPQKPKAASSGGSAKKKKADSKAAVPAGQGVSVLARQRPGGALERYSFDEPPARRGMPARNAIRHNVPSAGVDAIRRARPVERTCALCVRFTPLERVCGATTRREQHRSRRKAHRYSD